MDEATESVGRGQSGAALVDSACAACGGNVRLHLTNRATHGPHGTAGVITYADTDIAVWDCPVCGFANADAFGE
jgi:hypothetical protein